MLSTNEIAQIPELSAIPTRPVKWRYRRMKLNLLTCSIV